MLDITSPAAFISSSARHVPCSSFSRRPQRHTSHHHRLSALHPAPVLRRSRLPVASPLSSSASSSASSFWGRAFRRRSAKHSATSFVATAANTGEDSSEDPTENPSDEPPTTTSADAGAVVASNLTSEARPEWAPPWLPDIFVRYRNHPWFQLAILLPLYAVHLFLFSTKGWKFKRALIPNDKNLFQSIGYDSVAGAVVALGFFSWRRWGMKKTSQPVVRNLLRVEGAAGGETPYWSDDTFVGRGVPRVGLWCAFQ